MRKTTREGDLKELSRDAGIVSLTPQVAYLADTEEDVVLALREAAARGLPVTPRGGGTGIPTQSVGKGAILMQSRNAVNPGIDDVVCQPSVVKAELNKVLLSVDRWMPVDPSSYASCTVGGMVANNSSGIRTPKYGSTIDYVRRLRIIHPGGEAGTVAALPVEEAMSADRRTRKAASLLLENQAAIMGERPRVTKNSAGYRLERVLHDGLFDTPKLFVGSEGTLGVVTEATLGTMERPRWRLLFITESSLEDLDRTAGAFRDLAPAALELVDKSVFKRMGRWDRISKYSRSESPCMIFCELDGAGEGSSAKVEEVARSPVAGFDPILISSQSEISEAWGARNETLVLAQDIREGTKILVPGVEDLVVPPARLGDLVELLVDQFGRRGLDYIMYGHAGDANLHARPLLDPMEPEGRRTIEGLMEECFASVWKMGGSMTGEHGDGMLRSKYVERQYPRTFWIMRELKNLYDPRGLLNPGVKIA